MRTRSQRGQGLVEGACGTVFFMFITVFLIMLGINVYHLCTYDKELSQIAQECAKNVGESCWYNGMHRPNLTAPNDLRQRAQRIATELAAKLGIPASPSIKVTQGALPDHSIVCNVQVTATVPLPYSWGVFPSQVTLTRDRSYVSFSFGPTALANLQDQNGQGVQIPAYFYYTRIGDGANATIVRDGFGGGAGRFNTGDGVYFGGFVCEGSGGSNVSYFKGFNGAERSAVPKVAGASHGNLPINQPFAAK